MVSESLNGMNCWVLFIAGVPLHVAMWFLLRVPHEDEVQDSDRVTVTMPSG